MRITNGIRTQSFDTLAYGEFFTFVGESQINVKQNHGEYRPLENGRIANYVEKMSDCLVHPLELSTARFRRTSNKIV